MPLQYIFYLLRKSIWEIMPQQYIFYLLRKSIGGLCLYSIFFTYYESPFGKYASFRVVRVVGLFCQLCKVLIEKIQPIVQKRKGIR